ncbi:MAG: exodeoxyribonuclease VII small subunit [Nocardioidaceae bacterium]
MSEADPPPETLSYEQAREELIAVVSKLETGGISLQESIDSWERGEELANLCQRWLDGARARLDSVMQAVDTEETVVGQDRSDAD